MKKNLLLVLALCLVSCGPVKDFKDGVLGLAEGVMKVPRELAHHLLGTDSDTDERVDSLEEQLAELEQSVLDLEYNLNQVEEDQRQSLVELRNYLLRKIRKGDRRVKRQVRLLKATLERFVQGYVTIIDPCGNNDYSREILLQLHGGEILAVYKSGSNVYLGSLQDGNYITTDGRGCRFSIQNGQVVQ